MNFGPDEKIVQLEKILHSRAFQGSESLKAFLRFVVQKSVLNEASQLREHLIATEVFGRSAAYDSRTDSVVRVQAGRLRTKLGEYYATEGRADRIVINLPKGHYSPTFTSLDLQDAETPASIAEEIPSPLLSPIASTPVTVLSPPPPTPTTLVHGQGFWLKSLIVGLAVASLVSTVLALRFHAQVKELKSQSAVGNQIPADLQTLLPLWNSFFESPDPITVAYSNTVFQGRAETGMKLLNSLNATVNKRHNQESVSYDTSSPNSDRSVAISDHYTGVGEVMSVYFLSNLFWKANHPFRVKRSLLLTWEDVKAGNIVILGSPAENFITRELPQQQDFVFQVINEKDKERPIYGIVNLKPRPGEQSVYTAKEEGPSSDQVTEDYALVTLLKGLSDKHQLLILAGIKTYGTQAAAECVTQPEQFKELLRHIEDSQNASLPKHYQILLKVKVNGGVPVQTSYVTHHVLN